MAVNVKSSINEINDITTWNETSNNKHHKTLRQLLRPSLVSMAISGCYTYNDNLVTTEQTTSKGKPYRIFGTVYRLVFFIICASGCVKSAATFYKHSYAFLHLNVISCVWYTQCLIMFLISLKSNHVQYGGQRKAFKFWDEKIRLEMEALGLEFPEEKIKKRQKICLVVASVIVCFNIAGLSLLATDIFSEGFGAFFSAPFDKSVPSIFLEVCLFFTCNLIWIFTFFYIILVSILLTSTFEVFNGHLETHIQQNCATMTCQFQNIRQLHLNLCKMVSYVDQDFGCYFAVTFLFNVGLACFILYVMLKSEHDILELLMFVSWLIIQLALLGAISIFAAFLNETVSILVCKKKKKKKKKR